MLSDLYDILMKYDLNKQESLMFIEGICSIEKSKVKEFLEDKALENNLCPDCYEDTETNYSWYTDDEGYIIEEPSLFCNYCGWSLDD